MTNTATATTMKPLVARSNNGSLIAIHLRDSSYSSSSSFSQSNSNGLVRCYDGSVSSGALKFTLRFPLVRPSANSTNNYSDEVDNDRLLSAESSIDGLRKLVFASGESNNNASYLCGMCQSSTIHIWDLERGVLSQTFDARTSASSSSSASAKKKKKKEQRNSSLSTDVGKEILCDIITSGNQLYALMFFPTEEEEEGNGSSGKCRVYQYKLDSSGATLVKKIKVGSIHASSSSNMSNDTSSSSLPAVLAIAISKTTMIIRMGSALRIHDITTGEKLCKMDIPTDSILSSINTGNYLDETCKPSFIATTTTKTVLAPLACTSDGRFIVAGIYNQAVVFHHEEEEKKKNNEENKHHSLQPMALLSTKDDSPITNLDLLSLEDENKLGVLAFQQAEIASLFAVAISSAGASTSSSSSSSSSSLVPQMPKAKLLTNEKDLSVSFIGAGFHPRKQQHLHQRNETLQLIFQQSKRTGGSAAGSGTTLLPMESLPDALNSLEGTVIVGTSLTSLDDAKAKGNKRKIAESVALAPGDQGDEALLAMDLLQGEKTKKPRVSPSSEGDEDDEAEDEFPDDLDEDGEQRQSIAERLALLSSAMEETDDEDDDEDNDDGKDGQEGHTTDSVHRSKFKLNSATSETLTSLLTQALSSNDPTQLNIALQVTDRRLVEGTVRSLQSLDAERARQIMTMNQHENEFTAAAAVQQTRYIPTLMAHIVRRMARRHSLVMPLGVWIKAILAATARSSTNQAVFGHDNNNDITDQIMAKEGRDMARALGPLKNFLNERVECFSQMLKLDGRLALLNQQL